MLRRQVRRRTASLAEANDRLSRSEENLRVSLDRAHELNALKSQFVSTVSHEFRSPLGVILSSADILNRYHDRLPDQKRREHLESISRHTQSLAGLMEEVLVHSRIESGRMPYEPAPFDLAPFCRTLVNEMMSATGGNCPIHFTSLLADDVPEACGDTALLRHNLLSNAVKYSTPGTPVTFSVVRDGDSAVFTVSDQGIGIPPDELPHVFDGFHRGSNVGQRQGTGLGLGIARRCVELHDGGIQLTSDPGQGTSVVVRLPLFKTSTDSSSPPA